VNELKSQYHAEFMNFLKEMFKRDLKTSEVLRKTLAYFNASLKDETAKSLFLQRKIDEEKDEIRKQELQELKRQSEENNKKLMSEIQNSQERMREMEVEFARQEVEKKREFEQALEKLIKERDEMQEKMIDEITGLKTQHGQAMGNLNHSLNDLSFELTELTELRNYKLQFADPSLDIMHNGRKYRMLNGLPRCTIF